MSLEWLWHAYLLRGYAGLRGLDAANPHEHLYLALVAFSEGDAAQALAHAGQGALDWPGSRLLAEAAAYLHRFVEQGPTGVYVDGTAFAAFVRGGGNVPLYGALSAALRDVYTDYAALSLLDIGVGDGRALLPALTPAITRLTLLEPSAPMLARAAAALEARGLTFHSATITLQDYMPQAAETWDVIQATWSLQSIPPEERPDILAWLQTHGHRVLIAEFDVPAFDALLSPARVEYVAGRYERGLAEYEGSAVAQGFLMPVFFGYFDRTAARTNWEGPIAGWVDGLRAAGFSDVRQRRLYPYWWADAYLLDAT